MHLKTFKMWKIKIWPWKVMNFLTINDVTQRGYSWNEFRNGTVFIYNVFSKEVQFLQRMCSMRIQN